MDIRKGNQGLMGTTRENSQGSGQEAVYDSRNNYVGYTSPQGTFNAQGQRISASRAPGLLMK